MPHLRAPLLAAALLAAAPAAADLIPDEVAACRGQAAGAACTTPDGAPGTCAETLVTRPDYSHGVPPTYRQVTQLACVATAPAPARAWLMPGLGAGLTALALLLALRRPRAGAASAGA